MHILKKYSAGVIVFLSKPAGKNPQVSVSSEKSAQVVNWKKERIKKTDCRIAHNFHRQRKIFLIHFLLH